MKINQQGFTLIELITVIVILGILSAFALPRFAGLEKQARISAAVGMQGSMLSAGALAHGASLAQQLTKSQSVTLEGTLVTMTNSYPTANAAGIGAALQNTSGFTNSTAGNYVVNGAPTTSTCKATYTAAGVGASPSVTTATGGC